MTLLETEHRAKPSTFSIFLPYPFGQGTVDSIGLAVGHHRSRLKWKAAPLSQAWRPPDWLGRSTSPPTDNFSGWRCRTGSMSSISRPVRR